MFRWITTLFTSDRQHGRPETKPYHDLRWDLIATDAEVKFVKDCLAKFEEIGLVLNHPGNPNVAREVATEVLQSLRGTAEISPVTQDLNRIVHIRGKGAPLNVLSYQDGEDSGLILFRNSAVFEDHCYDGAYPGTFSGLVTEVCNLAAGDWPLGDVEASDFDGEGSVTISFDKWSRLEPFLMSSGKDMDWSYLGQLNRRVPGVCKKRFGYDELGGSTLIVFMEPEQIEALEKNCDHRFVIPG